MPRLRFARCSIALLLLLWIAVYGTTPLVGAGEAFDPIYGGIPLSANERGALTSAEIVVLPYRAFVVGYDEHRLNPLWVCYRIFRSDLSGSGTSRSWKADSRTAVAVTNEDYVHTQGDYDRGHMAPKAALFRCYGQDAVDDSYTLTNACPQRHPFNDGPWGDLEDLVRDEYSLRFDEIWVIAGPVFDDSNGRAYLVKDLAYADRPQKPVEIPDGFYKILIDLDHGIPRVLALLFDHHEGYSYGHGDTSEERLSGFLTSVDEIERVTGLDFLWTLPDPLEERLESLVATSMW